VAEIVAEEKVVDEDSVDSDVAILVDGVENLIKEEMAGEPNAGIAPLPGTAPGAVEAAKDTVLFEPGDTPDGGQTRPLTEEEIANEAPSENVQVIDDSKRLAPENYPGEGEEKVVDEDARSDEESAKLETGDQEGASDGSEAESSEEETPEETEKADTGDEVIEAENPTGDE
ncbi:hypothetical protein LCGC14_1259830, partial [marine sediment metagenome]